MSKICKQCCQELDLSEFQKDKSSKDGFSRNCRKCKSKLLSEWRSSHPESVKNSQNKDNIKRKYLINEASRQRYLNNPEYYSVKNKEWTESNRARRYAINHNYRARRLNAEGMLPLDAMTILISVLGEKCMIDECLNTELTIDHVIPLSFGGSNWIYNCQLLCKSHNSSKGAWHQIDYRSEEQVLKLERYI